MTDAKLVAPYGLCPFCGAPGVTRERRPNGNDVCESGHIYPSRNAVVAKPVEVMALIKWHKAMADEPKRNQAKREKHQQTHDALLAQQAEVARLTQENGRLKVELACRPPDQN